MASGNPKPAFYLAVLAVVLGLVGLALWRFGALPGNKGAKVSKDEMTSVTEAPDAGGITTAKEYKYVPAAKLPPVQGISRPPGALRALANIRTAVSRLSPLPTRAPFHIATRPATPEPSTPAMSSG